MTSENQQIVSLQRFQLNQVDDLLILDLIFAAIVEKYKNLTFCGFRPYFKYKASDVIKELTCTVGTIIATATLAKVYNYGFDLKAVLTSVIVAIVYLAFTWVMIQNAKKERKIFGKYTIALNLFTFALLAVLLFGLNMNVAIAIAISLAINSIVGYFIFQHNLKSGDVSLQ